MDWRLQPKMKKAVRLPLLDSNQYLPQGPQSGEGSSHLRQGGDVALYTVEPATERTSGKADLSSSRAPSWFSLCRNDWRGHARDGGVGERWEGDRTAREGEGQLFGKREENMCVILAPFAPQLEALSIETSQVVFASTSSLHFFCR